MKEEILILGIICLFIGVGFQPAFANNNITIKDEKQQPLGKTFRKTFGGEDWDSGNCVQQTAFGGYIIVGYTESFGDWHGDVWLIKTDSNGNMLWDKTFGGYGHD